MFCSQQNEELRKRLATHEKQLEKQKETILKCVSMTKKLLIEKVTVIAMSLYQFLWILYFSCQVLMPVYVSVGHDITKITKHPHFP